MSLTRPGALAFAFGVVVAGVACSPPYPRLSFAVEERLLRETTLDDLPEGEADADDAVVRIVGRGPNVAAMCTGALVTRRHVLTAQHCVVRTNGGKELRRDVVPAGDLRVELGGGYLPWGRVGVVAVHVCEGWAGVAARDVALLEIARAVPEDVPTMEIAYDEPTAVTVYELSGYGTAEKARAIPGTTFKLLATSRHTEAGGAVDASDDTLFVALRAVPGDSGGPVVDVSTSRVVGVASRGADPESVIARGRPPEVGLEAARLAPCRAMLDSALGT